MAKQKNDDADTAATGGASAASGQAAAQAIGGRGGVEPSRSETGTESAAPVESVASTAPLEVTAERGRTSIERAEAERVASETVPGAAPARARNGRRPSRPRTPRPAFTARQNEELERRLGALHAALETLQGELARRPTGEEFESVQAALAGFRTQLAALERALPRIDPAALERRIAELGAQLESLRGRLAQADPAQLAERIEALDRRLGDLEPTELQRALAELPRTFEVRLEEVGRGLQRRIGEQGEEIEQTRTRQRRLEGALNELDERLQSLQRRELPPLNETVQALVHRLTAVQEGLDRASVRVEPLERLLQQAPWSAERESLRNELVELRQQVEERRAEAVAWRAAQDGLLDRLRNEWRGEWQEWTRGAAQQIEAALLPFAGLPHQVQELRERLGRVDQLTAALAAIEQRLATLELTARELEGLDPRLAALRQELEQAGQRALTEVEQRAASARDAAVAAWRGELAQLQASLPEQLRQLATAEQSPVRQYWREQVNALVGQSEQRLRERIDALYAEREGALRTLAEDTLGAWKARIDQELKDFDRARSSALSGFDTVGKAQVEALDKAQKDAREKFERDQQAQLRSLRDRMQFEIDHWRRWNQRVYWTALIVWVLLGTGALIALVPQVARVLGLSAGN